MGTVASTLGIGIDFTWEDKAYRLSPWTWELMGVYERYMEAEAVEAAKRVGALLPRDEARALMKDLVKDIAAGLYTFGGPEVGRSLDCPKHLAKLLHLMLRESDPTVTLETAQRMIDTDLEQILDKISAATADPTRGGKKS